MTKRMLVHQRFYADPTKENLEELRRAMENAALEHIMRHDLAEYVIKQAEEYYDEMSRL